MRWIELRDDRPDVPPQVLTDAAASNAPATLMRFGPHDGVDARFHRVTQDEVVFSVVTTPDLAIDDPITVTFMAGDRVAVFMTRVRKLDGGERPLVRLDAPSQCFAEMRRHPRLNIGPQSDLVCRIHLGDRSWTPWVGDVSVGGTRLCFDEAVPDLGIGALIRVDMRLNHQAFSHVAMVVRQTDDSLGCRFQPIEEMSDTHTNLGLLLRELERERQNFGRSL